MKEKLKQIRTAALEQLDAADSTEKLEQLRVKFLGKKGELTAVLRGMGALSPEERPAVGQIANEIREAVEKMIADKKENSRPSFCSAGLKAKKLTLQCQQNVLILDTVILLLRSKMRCAAFSALWDLTSKTALR